MEDEMARAVKVATGIWEMVYEGLDHDESTGANEEEPLVQPDHEAPAQVHPQVPVQPGHQHPIQPDNDARVHPDHQASGSWPNRYLEERVKRMLERHGGSLSEAVSATFGNGNGFCLDPVVELDSASRVAAGSAFMGASFLASEDASIPPRRDEDAAGAASGTGAGVDRARPENHWTDNQDTFLEGMAAAEGRGDWIRKAELLNNYFGTHFTREDVSERCHELDAPSVGKRPGAAAPRELPSGCRHVEPTTNPVREVPSPSPSVRKMRWTTEEDEVLLAQGRRPNRKWDEVAKLLPGRTTKALKWRFRRIVQHQHSASVSAGTTSIEAMPKQGAPLATGASLAEQALKSPHGLAKQIKESKRGKAEDSPRTVRPVQRNAETPASLGRQQIPSTTSSTGRMYTHSLFSATIAPPQQPPQQQQHQQQPQGGADT